MASRSLDMISVVVLVVDADDFCDDLFADFLVFALSPGSKMVLKMLVVLLP
jgi:hypothetical protein